MKTPKNTTNISRTVVSQKHLSQNQKKNDSTFFLSLWERVGVRAGLLNGQYSGGVRAFTLVELIVVITILVILGAIAFTSLTGFSSNARDSDRVTTLKNIESGLDIHRIKSWQYPTPENISGTGTINNTILSSVGNIADSISRIIKMNQIPTDPVTKTNYIYGTNTQRTEYQIAAVLENPIAYTNSVPPEDYPSGSILNGSERSVAIQPLDRRVVSLLAMTDFVSQAHAASQSLQARVNGNYPGYIKYMSGTETWIANIPSLIFNNTGSTNFLSTGTYFVVNKQPNLPYKIDDKTLTQNKTPNEIIQAITNTDTATLTGVNITHITTNEQITATFTGTLLKSFWGNTAKMETAVLGKSTPITPQTPADCTLSGTTVTHGQTITAYTGTTIVWNASYDCTTISQERTCSNGTLSGEETYQYTACIKGPPTNCSASGTFVYNSHTYNIPQLNHSSGATDILSSTVSENNGTFKYTLTTITCNDGVLGSANENGTPTVQSCNANYGISGNGCVAIPSAPFASTANGITATGITWNWQTSANATRYEFSTDNTTFTDKGNVTSFNETGLTCATSYTRYVKACSAGGCSTATTLASASTNACPRVYATWNPSDKSSVWTLSNGNLTATSTSLSRGARGTMGKSSGKWYWEIRADQWGYMSTGIAPNSTNIEQATPVTGNFVYYSSTGHKFGNGTDAAYAATYATNDTIGVALDMDNKTLGFFKNNTYQGTAFTWLMGTLYPIIWQNADIAVATANFGATPLTYTPPNGTFWNPKDKGTNAILSNNNMTLGASVNWWSATRSNTSKSSGKWYWEVTVINEAASGIFVGVGKSSMTLAQYVGYDANGWGYQSTSALKYNNNSGVPYGTAYTTGDVIGVALDIDNGTLIFYKNGVSQGQAYSGLSGTFYIVASEYHTTGSAFLNTGTSNFAHSIPSGYSAWDSTTYNAGLYE